MLLHRGEYLQIIQIINSKIPRFLEKYPGYKIILFMLHFFNMIIQEKSSEEIHIFLNKELFPLVNQYNEFLQANYFDFNYLLENPDILKSTFYQQILSNVYKIVEFGLNLSFDWILWIEKEKDKDSPKAINYYKEKENFIKNIDMLIEFENEIVNNSKKSSFNKSHLFEMDLDKNIDIFHKLFEGNYSDFEEQKSFDNFVTFPLDLDKNKDPLSSNNNALYDDVNHVIFKNKNNFINCCFYNDKINNLKNNNLINKNNINFNNNINIISNSNISINDSFINTSTKENKSNTKVYTNESLKCEQFDLRKKRIKKYKFHILKRENVDKKVLRKFKKFLKTKLKEKAENVVKSYINNNKFWPDYIKMNLMPPFNYDKEKIKFKSFNTKYLCWFFDHKYALELFNIFIKINKYDILKLIENSYHINNNSDDYILLKSYIDTMPLIYGNKLENKSINYTSKIEQYEDEKINNETEKEYYKNNYNEINENMIFENDYIYSKENVNNINNIFVNNNLIKNDFTNLINNNYKAENNNINTIFNLKTILNEDKTDNNMNINLNENFNNNVLNDSFEDKKNGQNLDQSLFKYL